MRVGGARRSGAWPKYGAGRSSGLATTGTTSWAAVDWDGTSEDRFTVWQHGPRRLWNEAEIAYAWWTMHDRPGPVLFGATATATGEPAWLDDSDQPVPLIG
ncbi:hypothetical protein ASC82_21580 [Streptomyces sp. Root431]|uniref:hypothetical protein n=1 Tax=Streptomyces sp. Root431 TaxID=1736535 RepID=UPI0006FE6EEA|nr:hypothetical protein [Streptomyces sp. Root431]KQX10291.1 hypothetical protein ASC82_21580 [Streptomyces sp. Root431]